MRVGVDGFGSLEGRVSLRVWFLGWIEIKLLGGGEGDRYGRGIFWDVTGLVCFGMGRGGGYVGSGVGKIIIYLWF